MNITEKCIISKKGKTELCEDGIIITENYIAVIDGSTSKSDKQYDGKTTGKQSLDILLKAIEKLKYNLSITEVIEFLTNEIAKSYTKYNIYELAKLHPEERFTASCIIFSKYAKEIWMIGDCQCLVDGYQYKNEKKVDKLLSELRSYYIQCEMLIGKSITEFIENDTGRAYIIPAIKKQYLFQNAKVNSEYAYSAIDGFLVNMEKVKIISIKGNTKNIVLATDGYPKLKKTLEESEKYLKIILDKDPLLYMRFKSTKGLQSGNISYDDRAYVSFAPN